MAGSRPEGRDALQLPLRAVGTRGIWHLCLRSAGGLYSGFSLEDVMG